MFFTPQLAAIENFAAHQIIIFFQYFEIDQAIVYRNFVADIHGIQQFLIMNAYG
jgi:hypothetical protein